MKISVVVPAYNEEKFIAFCLNSLLKQSVAPDEIIVVDNNCNDKTVSVIRKFPGVKIVREIKQGMIYARNRGFNESHGDIIARCDADTIVPSDWIKKIRFNFTNKKIDALTGPLIFYDLPLKSAIYAKIYLKMMKYLQKGKETLIGPNMIITKGIWGKVKTTVCLDGKQVHEDIDLAIHINKVGGKIYCDNSLIIKESGRRISNNPLSFFGEYPLRVIKTFKRHDVSG